MTVHSLASSSKGNAYLVRQGDESLLIDDGLSFRELKKRAGDELDCLKAVLITHSHTDHISGLASLLKKRPELPVFANTMTAEAVVALTGVAEDAFICFENGQDFEIGPFCVHPFSIPHDTSDPVGYLIHGDAIYFHGTDIGTPLDSIGVQLAEADIATLESNHDLGMLYHSGRPPSLIQRISGPRGHLSNEQSADLVRRFASPRLRELRLAHLSHDCNLPDLAERIMREALADCGHTDITLEILTP